ncbi:MAG TPA: histidine kinase [Phnomibacter sp.]|nr:histidine kinase [Phnomibacter sp.]
MFPSAIGKALSVCMLLAAGLSIATNARAAGSRYEAAGFGNPVFLSVLAVVLALVAIAEFFVWRLQMVRKRELETQQVQAKMMELQERALRAQMNPHFIFNSLNSIKSLVQESKKEEAVFYLTTFTKLMRTLLQNNDKQYASLHDELETCRLYMELELMRFGDRFEFSIEVEQGLDLKSFDIPAFIIQPMVENAIWHGLIPLEQKGKLSISIFSRNEKLVCSIDDTGIGRNASMQINANRTDHQPRGVSLTHERMDLFRVLKKYDAQIEIIDKKDEDGKAAGTRIELSFSMN